MTDYYASDFGVKQNQNENIYKLFFDQNTLPMIIWDFDTLDILNVNEKAVSVYGYTNDEFSRMNLAQLTHEDDIELLKNITKTETAYNKIQNQTWRHKTKAGSIILIRLNGALFTINKKRIAITEANIVKEQIAAERELRESDEKYNLLFHKNPLPMWIYDLATYKVIEVNETAVVNYGYSRKEFLSMTILDFRPQQDIVTVTSFLENLKPADNLFHFGIYSHIKKDGTQIKVEVSGYRLYYQGIDCMMVVCNDVTEKERNLAIIKDSEQKLFASRQQLSLIYNNVKDTIFLIDVEENTKFKLTSFNQSFIETTGLSAEYATDKYIEEIIPEPSLTMVLSKYKEAIEKRTKLSWEETTEYPTGVKTGIVTINPVFNSDGICTQLIGSVYDITDHKKEEQRLKLLESVITNTKDAVMITEAEPFDEPGPRILYVNEAFTKMTGYSAEEVLGKTPRILQGPKSDFGALRQLSQAMRNWETYEITTLNYKKNGEEFWINFSVTPVADATGWFTHWIAIERDVTAQKNAEQAMLALFNERNSILESIGDAFFAIDNNWIVTYWNKVAETIMKKGRDEIIGKDLREVYPNTPGRISYLYYEKAFAEKKVQNFEIHNAEVNLWFEVIVYPSATGLSIYFRDITERLNYNNTLNAQNTKLVEIAWMQSHIARAPVANILGLINLLKDPAITAHDRTDLLNRLYTSAQKLDEVIINVVERITGSQAS